MNRGSLPGGDGGKEAVSFCLTSFILTMLSRQDCPLGKGRSLSSSLLKFLALGPWESSPQGGSTLKCLKADLTIDVASSIFLTT